MLSNSLSKKLLSKNDKNKKKCKMYKNFTLTKLNNNNLTTFNNNLHNNTSERYLIQKNPMNLLKNFHYLIIKFIIINRLQYQILLLKFSNQKNQFLKKKYQKIK